MATTITPAPGMIQGVLSTVATNAPVVERLPMCRRLRITAINSSAATIAYQTEEARGVAQNMMNSSTAAMNGADAPVRCSAAWPLTW